MRRSIFFFFIFLLITTGAGVAESALVPVRLVWSQDIPSDFLGWEVFISVEDMSAGDCRAIGSMVKDIPYVEGMEIGTTIEIDSPSGLDLIWFIKVVAKDLSLNYSECSDQVQKRIDLKPPAIPGGLRVEDIIAYNSDACGSFLGGPLSGVRRRDLFLHLVPKMQRTKRSGPRSSDRARSFIPGQGDLRSRLLGQPRELVFFSS